MKTFKQFISEEGYDVARDQGRVRPSKDKKDATTMPPSKEMKKTQKVNKGPSAFELVKKKYGKSVMNMKKCQLYQRSNKDFLESFAPFKKANKHQLHLRLQRQLQI